MSPASPLTPPPLNGFVELYAATGCRTWRWAASDATSGFGVASLVVPSDVDAVGMALLSLSALSDHEPGLCIIRLTEHGDLPNRHAASQRCTAPAPAADSRRLLLRARRVFSDPSGFEEQRHKDIKKQPEQRARRSEYENINGRTSCDSSGSICRRTGSKWMGDGINCCRRHLATDRRHVCTRSPPFSSLTMVTMESSAYVQRQP
jgi:hypothetical protein